MDMKEFRRLEDTSRRFAAMYGLQVGLSRNMTPVQFMAGHFAGLNTMPKDEFVRVMNGAGKALLRMGIDCRTDAERIRHQLHQIKTGQVAPGEKPV